MDVVENDDKLLPPGEVAQLLGVNIKTLNRWANSGKIAFIRTLGGHRRYRQSSIEAILSANG